MKKFFNQIPVKIGVSILLIETILLSMMGVFYVRSFNREIDQRVLEKLALPGILMSQRALNYDSVNNHQIIGELVHETVLETFITKRNGVIFYAADELMLGKHIKQFLAPEEQLQITDDSARNQQITFKTSEGNNFISSLSEIRHNDKNLGFLYIKIDSTKIEQEKRHIVLLFLLGSLLTIFLTTLVEAFYIHRLFVPRIQAISTVLKRTKTGDLTTRVSLFGPEDEFHVLIHLINSMLNTVSETITTLTDTQEALKASGERFRELSDLLPEGVFELDVNGYFTYVNLQLCEVSQYSREELCQKLQFTDILIEEDIQRSSENFKERIEGQLNVSSEYKARRKDGTVLQVMVNASSIVQQDQFKGLRGIVVDLTEKNRLQKQLWQTQKMESIGQLSASIAHEFGNPLVGIHWLLVDIQHLPNLDESQKQLVALGLQECKKLKKLITNFQAFAKPSSDEKRYYDINQILDDILLLYKKYITDKNVDIVINYQKNLPRIQVVKDQVHQVFVNILMNALDALHANKRKIFITTLQRDSQVLVIIKDNGCGITDENLDHIFEPFFSTKPEAKGTGLGLYVSHLITKNHNGKIQVESTRGEGSIFTISLPVEGLAL